MVAEKGNPDVGFHVVDHFSDVSYVTDHFSEVGIHVADNFSDVGFNIAYFFSNF